MSRPIGGDWTLLEDWTDIQLLGQEPMDTLECDVWESIVLCYRSGRIAEMLKLVAIFESLQSEVIL